MLDEAIAFTEQHLSGVSDTRTFFSRYILDSMLSAATVAREIRGWAVKQNNKVSPEMEGDRDALSIGGIPIEETTANSLESIKARSRDT